MAMVGSPPWASQTCPAASSRVWKFRMPCAPASASWRAQTIASLTRGPANHRRIARPRRPPPARRCSPTRAGRTGSPRPARCSRPASRSAARRGAIREVGVVSPVLGFRRAGALGERGDADGDRDEAEKGPGSTGSITHPLHSSLGHVCRKSVRRHEKHRCVKEWVARRLCTERVSREIRGDRREAG